jgi:hypothetical protein
MLTVSQLCRYVLLDNAEHRPAIPDRVDLPKSGLNPLKGRVFITIRERYVYNFKMAALSVLTDHSIRSQLEDIAMVAKTSKKARLLDRHEDWLLVLDSAVGAADKHFKKRQTALKLLADVDEDSKEFSKGIYLRASKRSKVAKSARKNIVNLCEDLKDFIHEQ